MLLAAGLGSRLRPLSDELPKPLLPVGDRPALAHVLDRLAAAEIRRFVVNAFHLGDVIEGFFEAARRAEKWGATELAVSREAELLGTAGGVERAAGLLGAGDVLVWNGDILAAIDVTQLVTAHRASGAGATLCVRAAAGDSGNVGLDAEGRVVRLRRETTRPGEVRSADFLGVHVVGAELRARLPPHGCLIADLYLPALHVGAEVRAVPHEGDFWDIGSSATYLDANMAWLAARGEGSFVHPTARVSPKVTLERVVVGAGATILGEGILRDVVVWPGAQASAPLVRSIVTPRHAVAVD